ncbi:uncharacterized protein B0H18DRAFT_327754 [Fomitopsis serialis]|uniref:uncharacterized protein n=1 Tax=Fomitopsis serialis TaxID=139415 RepID=UPI0020083136|nr:uncharacterized protein B0H18DRAFT_327754 [Neoantrodia serialis]KAH9936621.1 hypothetical protein B0H18DRAFT_327754 [Neoantrodia serialis]
MPPTPSSIISDALNSLSKAANLALATVEEQARTDVTRANAEVSEARRERDDALKTLRDLRLQEKSWERREESWKASVDKAELTVKHQAETISHLRAESAQWKAQLTRLEETSRQEVNDWKERCLHAEQERCQLSSRIDELVAEQLAYNTQANAALGALASRSPYPDLFELSSSSTKRASTSSVAPPLNKRQTSLAQAPDHDAPPPARKTRPVQTPSKHASQIDRPVDPPPSRTPKHKSQPTEPPPAATKAPRTPNTPRATPISRAAQNSHSHSHPPPPEPSSSVPQQRVIRRVQAVISVPVKEEEESDVEPFESDASGSAYEPEDEQPVLKRNNRRATAGQRQSRARRVVEDEDEGEEETRSHRHVRPGRYVLEDEDDTDELAMGREDEFDPPQQTTPRTKTKTARTPATHLRRNESLMSIK